MALKKAKVVSKNLPYETMTCKEALNTARAFSGKTYNELADSMGIGTETVRRYHTDLAYNPPLPRVPDLNAAYGNDILVQWICRKCGGIFVRVEGVKSGAELQEEIAILTKEFSDVLSVHAEAIKDGKITKEEAIRLAKEAEELLIKAAEVLFAVKKGFQLEEGE